MSKIFLKLRTVFALLLLPNCPRLDCHVSGLVYYKNIIFWSKPPKEIEIASDKKSDDVLGAISSLDVPMNKVLE